jgi:hypothetical protein
VSPKQSSLAFIEETTALDLHDEDYQPVLNVLDKSRHKTNSSVTDEVISIRGRVTVSF